MFLTLPTAPPQPSTLQDAHQIIARLHAQVEQLTSLARLDPLTGIANRRAFDERLAQAFAHARRTRTALAVAVFDLDNFKRRNDTFGHAAGDRCLCLLAAQLASHSRAGDVVARIGGEEFAVIMPATSQVDGADLCRRIAFTLRQGCAAGGPLTFSCGVAELDATMLHPCTILDHADRAMYHAKQSGKDRVCVHQTTFNRAAAFFGRLGIR
jgi:diguanylate cyclase (GGDEF)-like protein